MNGPPSDSDALLTGATIKSWLAEREDVRRMEFEVKRRASDLDLKLQSAEVLVGPTVWKSLTESRNQKEPADDSFGPDSKPEANAPELQFRGQAKRLTADWLSELLDAHGQSLNEAELSDLVASELAKHGLPGVLTGFKKLVEGAARRGKLRKRDGFFYSPSIWQRTQSGEIQPRTGTVGDMKAAVLRALRELQTGTAREIVQRMRTDETIIAKLNKNPQYAYNVLSRLSLDGDLIREEGVYRFPDQERAAA